jgi:hypothetical protein
VKYFLSIRPWAALGILVALGAVILGVFVVVESRDSGVTGEPIPHRVELVAVVTAVQAPENWAVVEGKTVGEATLALDDGRSVTITGNTIGEISCTDFSSPNSCVLLADVLGPAVVWFALVPADERNGDEVLTLPALVDMLDGGDLGVTSNGWVVRLTTGVERTCDTETVSLRDFINKFSPDSSVTILDLLRDEVTEVVCRQ